MLREYLVIFYGVEFQISVLAYVTVCRCPSSGYIITKLAQIVSSIPI